MQKVQAVREALAETARELQNLEEFRSMVTMNSGFSEIRNRALGEMERIIQERRETLLWVLDEDSSINI